MTGTIRKALLGGAAFVAMLGLGAPSVASAQRATPAQPQELSKLQRQEEFAAYMDGLLSAMEAARRGGNCDQLQNLKAQVELGLGLSAAASLFPPEAITGWKKRADTILQRPCPPSSGAPPVESVVDDLQPNPATIIGTPERLAGSEEIPSSAPSPPTSGLNFDEPEADERFPGDPFYYLLQIFFDFREEGIPDTGIGFRRDGPPGEAPEEFAVTTPDRVSMIGGGGSVDFPLGGTRIRIGAGYSEGDASNSFEIPGDSGVDSGVVYGAPAPSGSSGIATPFGLTGWTEVGVRRYAATVDVSLNKRFSDGWMDAGGLQLNDWRIYAGFARVERDYMGFATYTGAAPGGFVFEFSQDRWQEVRESYYRAGSAIELAAPLGERLIGRFEASAGGYYRDSDLRSTERNVSNFGPMEDRDFTHAIEDSERGFGFEGEAGATLEFALSPRVSVLAGGSARYLSDVGAIFNPSSGDQVFFDGLTTAFETEDAWSWRVGGGIVVRFGGG